MLVNPSWQSLLPILPVTAGQDATGCFTLAGICLTELADQFGTPLYLYDAQTVRDQYSRLSSTLERAYPGAFEITYAAKAYFAPGFARKLAGLGLGVDVVSLGELRVARAAGFHPARVHLHGNNKSVDELADALEWGIQSIVVDNFDELALLESLVSRPTPIWLRVSPDVSVDTHSYLQTAHAASKFGFSSVDAVHAARRAQANPLLRMTGLHTHLGSQFFQPAPYRDAVLRLIEIAEEAGIWLSALSPGGGWGVPYLPGAGSDDPTPWIETVSAAVQQAAAGKALPQLVVEPGRWLAARAAVAVYRVGAVKTAPDGTRIVAVDGGMADNPRTALYGAQYTAFLADRPGAPIAGSARVVGKYCESGDELIHSAPLPETRRGDLLVIPVAGAYQLSMASNYNMAPRPAVLWLDQDRIEVLQPRENLDAGWWGSSDC